MLGVIFDFKFFAVVHRITAKRISARQHFGSSPQEAISHVRAFSAASLAPVHYSARIAVWSKHRKTTIFSVEPTDYDWIVVAENIAPGGYYFVVEVGS